MESSEEISPKEKRIREITLAYYSRPDIRKAIFDFSLDRECVPRYFEGFGKRPDAFQYDSDIFELAKKGATSFHCSEELWSDPLMLSTDMTPKELNELRIGWDLVLDIDSPYLEYSKIYASLLVEALESHGIKNIGCKFSGSKGIHMIVPWIAFPKEIYGQKTSSMFPELPRTICNYLSDILKKKFEDTILQSLSFKEIARLTGKKESELLITECKICHRHAEKRYMAHWECNVCKYSLVMQEKTKRIPKCPECRREMDSVLREEMDYCPFCEINSKKNPELFEKERIKTEDFTVADLILVSPRHLFRMPYSLHEKTALASVVIDKDKIKDFQMIDAKPFKVKIKNFMPSSVSGEAKSLVLKALDWKEQKEKESKMNIENYENKQEFKENKEKPKKEFGEIALNNITEDILPPCIKLLLKGVKDDGRKRALFILINFLKSLKLPENEIERIINEWNSKNYSPLKLGYIKAQLIWYKKNSARLPPNCDKTNYRELNICKPDELCKKIKNPINYTIRKYLSSKRA